MAFSYGTGMLSTDPRTKKNATGGSIHAGQKTDTSVLITGNRSDGTIGYGDPSAFTGGLFTKPAVAPAPDFNDSSGYGMEKTSAEIEELTEGRGVANTQANTGSLAVDFRASEQAKTDAGEQTTTQERATKVIDARGAEEYKRTISEPFQAEQAKFRSQALSAKNLLGQYSNNMSSQMNQMKSSSRGIIRPTGGASTSSPGLFGGGDFATRKAQHEGSDRSGNKQIIGPDFNSMMAELNSVSKQNPDIGAIAATHAHAAAPGTQPKSTKAMADAQSATGKATPAQMSQAMISAQARATPNKGN